MRLLVCLTMAGALAAQVPTPGPGWFSDREYENLKLSFDYKLAQWAEAAIVLRTPKTGRPVQQGVSITLAHDFHKRPGTYTTGAASGLKEPLHLLPESYGVWHSVEIVLEGLRLTVKLDGELIQDAKLPEQKLAKGYLHFPDLQHKYEIRNLTVAAAGNHGNYVDAWQPWALRGAGTWQSGANSATGSDGHGILYGTPKLIDFLFSAEVKATNFANGGVFFRGAANEKLPRGFEVQIYSPLDSVFPTGSIYGLARSHIAADTENRWFYLQVLVRGRRCQVWVDGVAVAETDALPEGLNDGQIGLQIHMEKTSVEWKNLRALRLE